jgi:hypothetical protein
VLATDPNAHCIQGVNRVQPRTVVARFIFMNASIKPRTLLARGFDQYGTVAVLKRLHFYWRFRIAGSSLSSVRPSS